MRGQGPKQITKTCPLARLRWLEAVRNSKPLQETGNLTGPVANRWWDPAGFDRVPDRGGQGGVIPVEHVSEAHAWQLTQQRVNRSSEWLGKASDRHACTRG